MVLCTVAKGELGEVSLEVIVAAYDAILCDDQKFLVL